MSTKEPCRDICRHSNGKHVLYLCTDIIIVSAFFNISHALFNIMNIFLCLASLKHDVIAYDDDKKIINKLKNNTAPLFEPGLDNLIAKTTKEKKLSFSNNLNKLNSASIVWFAHDIPVNENDEADTKNVLNKIKNTLKKLKTKKYVIISSQLPVGTIESLENYSKNNPDNQIVAFLNSTVKAIEAEELVRQKNYDLAEISIKKFISSSTDVLGANSLLHVESLGRLAEVYFLQKRYQDSWEI